MTTLYLRVGDLVCHHKNRCAVEVWVVVMVTVMERGNKQWSVVF